MALPADDAELTRWANFAVTRWQLDHEVKSICMQATCLGMPMTREDFFMIIRAYVDCQDEARALGKEKQ